MYSHLSFLGFLLYIIVFAFIMGIILDMVKGIILDMGYGKGYHTGYGIW
jgi:uncharacterized membrane protein (DUF106 family)